MLHRVLSMWRSRQLAAFWMAALIGGGMADARPKPPRPPRNVFAIRVGPGVIGVEWRAVAAGGLKGYRVLRSESARGTYRPVAVRDKNQPYCLDADVRPSKVYFYKVTSLGRGEAESSPAGPACAWDDDQMLADGSFEFDALGEVKGVPFGWARRAYNGRTPVLIVEGGPDGRKCVEIRSSNTFVSGGLHSGFIPAVEGETFDQLGWAKSLPGAKPLIGRCFYTEKRKPVKVGKKPYDYTVEGGKRSDGWSLYEGAFTVPPTGAYCVLWFIGFRARNTYWFDGARLIDRTSKRVREFPYAQRKAEVATLLQRSATARKHCEEFGKLEHEMAAVRQQMSEGLPTLTPLAYRRLLVALDRAQQEYTNLLWRVKTLALLKD